MSTQTMTNGDASSKLLDHIKSYPVVHDGVETFKSHPVGQKSIDLTQTGYNKFVAPVVPYAKGPYGYVAPYVAKADSLASDGLTKVDETFPIVKEDTQKIKGTVLDYAYFPFRLANDGKNYVLDTYGSEYKKCGGDGYVSGGKALITTSMVVTSDTLAWLSSFLSAKKQKGQDYAGAKYKKGQEYAHQTSNYVNEKSGEAMKYAQEKNEQAKEMAYQKTDEAKAKGHEAKKTAQDKTKQ
ncbi:MAG: hypothetical protein Q9217_002175 [Psora testacea]